MTITALKENSMPVVETQQPPSAKLEKARTDLMISAWVPSFSHSIICEYLGSDAEQEKEIAAIHSLQVAILANLARLEMRRCGGAPYLFRQLSIFTGSVENGYGEYVVFCKDTTKSKVVDQDTY